MLNYLSLRRKPLRCSHISGMINRILKRLLDALIYLTGCIASQRVSRMLSPSLLPTKTHCSAKSTRSKSLLGPEAKRAPEGSGVFKANKECQDQGGIMALMGWTAMMGMMANQGFLGRLDHLVQGGREGTMVMMGGLDLLGLVLCCIFFHCCTFLYSLSKLVLVVLTDWLSSLPLLF